MRARWSTRWRGFNQAAVDADDLQSDGAATRGFPGSRRRSEPSPIRLLRRRLQALGLGLGGGLVTDAHARVMRHGGVPVRTLYARGNAAAKTEIGVGYQAGLTLASSWTFGLRAAEHIVASKPSPAG